MNNEYKIAIIIPCHIALTNEFTKSLLSVSEKYTVIIVDDSNGKVEYPSNWVVYDYQRQQEELGDELYEQFKVFHKSSACRNFGHWIAYKQGFDIIIGLDSDCVVPPDFISKHLEALMSNSYGWENPIKNTNWFPRGFPYHERMRKTILNIGLWENELDVNGIDRVRGGQPPKSPMNEKQEIAHGMIPLCGMNFAMWAYAVPAFLFLPNFDDGDEKFRRYDDIWGGYIFQKLMQLNKDMITFGNPVVFHDTIVEPQADADLETAGINWEETFYHCIDAMCSDIDSAAYPTMFRQFANASLILKDTPFKTLITSLNMWVKMFEEKKHDIK